MAHNLADVSCVELNNFVNSFDSVLCDCDGVIFIMFKAIPGAADCIEKLGALGKTVQFVSNNGTRSRENFLKALTGIGLNIEMKDLITPVVAIVSYLKSIKFEKKIFVIGFSGLKKDFTDAGFEIADYGPDSVEESMEKVSSHLQDDLNVGAVVFDFDFNVNYIRMQKALIYIRRPDVLFITATTDKEIPVGKSTALGCGHFQNALQELSGKEAMVFGKPGKHLNDYILNKYQLNPQRTLFIGDTFSDMDFATEGGYQKLLVLTGVVKEKDLQNCANKSVLSKYYVNSLKEFHQLLETKLQ